MRIALVTYRFDRQGGAEWDCWALSQQLVERGHDVHLVAAQMRVPLPAGITLHPVKVFGSAFRGLKYTGFARSARRVWETVGADVSIGFNRTPGCDIFKVSGGCHSAYMRRKAAQRGPHEGLRQKVSPYDHGFLFLERRMYDQPTPTLYLAVSELSRKEMLEEYPTLRSEDIEVVHYGVDTEAFHPRNRAILGAQAREELGIAPDRPLVLFVGSGFERKGVDTLLEVWRREPPGGAALVVVGKDQRIGAYRRAGKSLDGDVYFTGARGDVERMHAMADVLALPSIYEGCPVSILEALATGVPVVTSTTTGAPEILSGPLAKLLVDDPRDVAAVGDRLRIALDPLRREELTAAARAAGCASGLDEVTSRMEAYCERFVTRKIGAAR